ncbi:MAG: DUF302 domain-containing protein [Pseudomonadota bacterium]
MRILLALCAALGLSAAAQADEIVRVKSDNSVPDTMAALNKAVEGAGATVFARVDHAAGAQRAGMELDESQLLVFGNPKLGTPAIQNDALAGLFLPLRVLVYQDGEGQVWLAYQDPTAMLGALDGTPDGAEYLQKMTGALAKLTAAAANGQ